MVKKREFRLPSSDGRSRLHVVLWEPSGPVQAVFQIVHGMTEYTMRYAPFAAFLGDHGIAVIGHDHLGHGKTVNNGEYGYFSDQDGHVCVIKDVHRVSRWMHQRYPEKSYYMMGHSMGSFFLRRYITLYDDLTGAVIMGTGDHPLPVLTMGKAAVGILGAIRGKKFRSVWMHQMVLGNYSKAFFPVRTRNDWLSKNQSSVTQFCKDPWCNFHFTCSAYWDFFNILLDLKLKRQIGRLSRDLPVLLVSGAQDPVGGFGKGVRRVYNRYKKMGMRDVQIMLYPNDRHEILNETDKEEVYQDILNWILYHL